MLFRKFVPDQCIGSIYDFDFKQAWKEGRRGIILDIDNTLVPHNAPAEPRSDRLLGELLSMGFRVGIVSNNCEERVRSFIGTYEIPYVFKACKPSVAGFEKMMTLLGTGKENTLAFGDQLFTDILGALRAGITCVAVKPVDLTSDSRRIRFKRMLERPIRRYLYHKGLANESFII